MPDVFGQDDPLVDRVVQASAASPTRTTTEPLWNSADDDEGPLVSLYVLTRLPLTPETHWVTLKRDDSTSVPPAPPLDSTPTPP